MTGTARGIASVGAGVQTLFLLFPLNPDSLQLASNAVQAAQAAGVKHIVRSSGAGADADSPVAIARLQGSIDALIDASGIAYTLLRPNGFMQNWVNFHAGQLKAGSYAAPHGEAGISVVDVRDIAEAAAGLRIWGLPEVMVGYFMSLNDVYKQGWAAGVSPDVERLTGHAPRRFADFAQENASAFQA